MMTSLQASYITTLIAQQQVAGPKPYNFNVYKFSIGYQARIKTIKTEKTLTDQT